MYARERQDKERILIGAHFPLEGMPVPANNVPFNLKDSWIVSDNTIFLQRCTAQGFKTQSLNEIEFLPAQSLVFAFCNEAARRTFEIAKQTPAKRSVFCAVYVFEASVKSALYGLDLILKSDFDDALQKQRLVLTQLDTCRQFNLDGCNSQARVTISEQATPYAMIEEDISNDFIHSIAEFFEVHYAHMNIHAPCPFQFTGHLTISGILTVLRKPPTTTDIALKIALEKLTHDVAQHTALLAVENNILISFRVNDTEHKELLNCAAGARGLKLTEFAVGVNKAIAPFIDYRINAQMNEGISGVHVALGDGSTGYHIDFLSPGVAFNPLPR